MICWTAPQDLDRLSVPGSLPRRTHTRHFVVVFSTCVPFTGEACVCYIHPLSPDRVHHSRRGDRPFKVGTRAKMPLTGVLAPLSASRVARV